MVEIPERSCCYLTTNQLEESPWVETLIPNVAFKNPSMKATGGWVFWTQTALFPCLCQSLAQSCSTLCDPMDYSLPGSSVHRLFQARILEWVAIFLLHGIFPTQGLNPCLLCLLHCRRILYLRSHQGSPSPCLLVAQSCLTLCNPMDCSPARLICPWNSLGKNTGVGCHSLLQGIFPTQGLNPGLPHCRQILYCVSHGGWGPANKYCTFLYYNLVPVGWLCYKAGKWTQIRFSNNFSKNN